MPIKSTMLGVVESSVAGGSIFMAVVAHWAAIAVHEKKLPRGVLTGQLFGAGLSGLGTYFLLNDVSPWPISIVGALFVAGVVGFVWGPAALYLLAKIGQEELAKKLGLDASTLPNVPVPKEAVVSNAVVIDPIKIEQTLPTPSLPTISTSPEINSTGGESNAGDTVAAGPGVSLDGPGPKQ